MNASPANGTSANASVNGTGPEGIGHGDNVDVNVEASEIVGVSIMGTVLLLMFFALLRAHRRERKLLERLAEHQD